MENVMKNGMKNGNLNCGLYNPTVKLLNSSTVVGISAAFRLYIAFLIAGMYPNTVALIAFGLVIYATYNFDRCLDSKEDAINRKELGGANKIFGMYVCFAAFIAGYIMFASLGIYLAPLILFTTGYFYSKGIKIGERKIKLKGGMGIKNLVVGSTWGLTIMLIVGNWVSGIFTLLSVFVFYTVKLFINSSLYDIKDIEGDIAAGIKTLPSALGLRKYGMVMSVLCFVLHLSMLMFMIQGFIKPYYIVGIYSFFVIQVSLNCLSLFEFTHGIRKYIREALIDGESSVVVLLVNIFRNPI